MARRQQQKETLESISVVHFRVIFLHASKYKAIKNLQVFVIEFFSLSLANCQAAKFTAKMA
jgi:hypothetical protein